LLPWTSKAVISSEWATFTLYIDGGLFYQKGAWLRHLREIAQFE